MNYMLYDLSISAAKGDDKFVAPRVVQLLEINNFSWASVLGD